MMKLFRTFSRYFPFQKDSALSYRRFLLVTIGENDRPLSEGQSETDQPIHAVSLDPTPRDNTKTPRHLHTFLLAECPEIGQQPPHAIRLTSQLKAVEKKLFPKSNSPANQSRARGMMNCTALTPWPLIPQNGVPSWILAVAGPALHSFSQ